MVADKAKPKISNMPEKVNDENSDDEETGRPNQPNRKVKALEATNDKKDTIAQQETAEAVNIEKESAKKQEEREKKERKPEEDKKIETAEANKGLDSDEEEGEVKPNENPERKSAQKKAKERAEKKQAEKEKREREEKEEAIRKAKENDEMEFKKRNDVRENEELIESFLGALKHKVAPTGLKWPSSNVVEQRVWKDIIRELKNNGFATANWIILLENKFKAIAKEVLPTLGSGGIEQVLEYLDENDIKLLHELEKIKDKDMTLSNLKLRLYKTLQIPGCAKLIKSKELEQAEARAIAIQNETSEKKQDNFDIKSFVRQLNLFEKSSPPKERFHTQINEHENALLAKEQRDFRQIADWLVSLDRELFSGILAGENSIYIEFGTKAYCDGKRATDDKTDSVIQITCIACGTPTNLSAFVGIFTNGQSITGSQRFTSRGACCSKSCALKLLLRALEDAIDFNATNPKQREHQAAILRLILTEAKAAFKNQLAEDKEDQRCIRYKVENREVPPSIKFIEQTTANDIENLKELDKSFPSEVLVIAGYFEAVVAELNNTATRLIKKSAKDKSKTPITTEIRGDLVEAIEQTTQQLFGSQAPLNDRLRMINDLLSQLSHKHMGSTNGNLEFPYIKVDGTATFAQIISETRKIGSFFKQGISPLIALIEQRLLAFDTAVGETHSITVPRDASCITNVIKLIPNIKSLARETKQIHARVMKIIDDETKRFLRPVSPDLKNMQDLYMEVHRKGIEGVAAARMRVEFATAKLREAEKTIEREKQNASELQVEIDTLKNQNRQLEAKYSDKKSIDEMENVVFDSRMSEINRREKAIAQTESEQEKFRKELGSIEKDIQKQKTELEKEKAKSEKEKSEALSKIPKKTGASDTEIRALKSEIAKHNTTIENMKRNATDAEKSYREALTLRDERIKTMQKIAQQVNLTEDEQKIAKLEGQLKEEKSRYEKLETSYKADTRQANIDRKKLDLADARKNESLAKEIETLKKELENSKAQSSEANKWQSRLNLKAEELENLQKKTEEDLGKRKAFTTDLEKRKNFYKRMNEKQEEEAKDLKSKINDLEIENATLKNRPEGTPQDSEKLHTLQSKIDKLKLEAKEDADTIMRLRSERDEQKRYNSEQEQAMHTNHAETLKKSVAYHEVSALLVGANNDIEAYKRQMIHAREEIGQLSFEIQRLKQKKKENDRFQVQEQIKSVVGQRGTARSLTPDTIASQRSQTSEAASERTRSADGRHKEEIRGRYTSSTSSSSSSSLMPPPPPLGTPYDDDNAWQARIKDIEKRTGRSRERSRDKTETDKAKEKSESRGSTPPAADIHKILRELQEENKRLRSQQEENRKREGDKSKTLEREAKPRWYDDKDNRETKDEREKSEHSDKRERRQDSRDNDEKDSDKRRPILKRAQRDEDLTEKKDWCFHHWDEIDAGRSGCKRAECRFDHIDERQPCWSWDRCKREDCKFGHVKEEEWRRTHPNYPQRPNQSDNKRKATSEKGDKPNKRPDTRPDNRKNTLCKYFSTRNGCSKKNDCPFLHATHKDERNDKRNKKGDRDDDGILEDDPNDQEDREPKDKIDDRSAPSKDRSRKS